MVESLRRDFNFGKNDNFIFFLDPFNDLTNGYTFGANAAGAQWDGALYEGGKNDLNWDNKWESVVKNYEDKWIFEAAIPFKTIRYKKGITQWGVNFSRMDITAAEKSSWAPVPRQFPTAALAYTGQLVWDQPLPSPGLNLSLIPVIKIESLLSTQIVSRRFAIISAALRFIFCKMVLSVVSLAIIRSSTFADIADA